MREGEGGEAALCRVGLHWAEGRGRVMQTKAAGSSSGSSSEASQHKLLNFMLWPDNAGAGEETEGGREVARVARRQQQLTHTHTHKQTDSDAHASQALRKSVAVNVDCSVGVGSAVTLIASVAAPALRRLCCCFCLLRHATLCCGERESASAAAQSFAANLLSMR